MFHECSQVNDLLSHYCCWEEWSSGRIAPKANWQGIVHHEFILGQQGGVQEGAHLCVGGNLHESSQNMVPKSGCSCLTVLCHIGCCLWNVNSLSMILLSLPTHCILLILNHITFTSSCGWRVVTSRMQWKFRWLWILHCRRLCVVAVNCVYIGRSV